MKRIFFAFLLSLFAMTAKSQLETISYKDFIEDEAPTDTYRSHLPLMAGLRGTYTGEITVDAILENKCGVSANTYFEKSAEICNKLYWGPEMVTDGSDITPGYIRYWWENGFDAMVTLDWAINSGRIGTRLVPYLELKSNKLNNQQARCFRFKDGNVLVMLKIGMHSCANMFLRLLRVEPVAVEKKVTLGEEEKTVTLGPTFTPPDALALVLKKQLVESRNKYAPVTYAGCCGGGVMLVGGGNTTTTNSSGNVTRPGPGSSGNSTTPGSGGTNGNSTTPGSGGSNGNSTRPKG